MVTVPISITVNVTQFVSTYLQSYIWVGIDQPPAPPFVQPYKQITVSGEGTYHIDISPDLPEGYHVIYVIGTGGIQSMNVTFNIGSSSCNVSVPYSGEGALTDEAYAIINVSSGGAELVKCGVAPPHTRITPPSRPTKPTATPTPTPTPTVSIPSPVVKPSVTVKPTCKITNVELRYEPQNVLKQGESLKIYAIFEVQGNGTGFARLINKSPFTIYVHGSIYCPDYAVEITRREIPPQNMLQITFPAKSTELYTLYLIVTPNWNQITRPETMTLEVELGHVQ